MRKISMNVGLSFSVWKHDGLRVAVVQELVNDGFTYALRCGNPSLDLFQGQRTLGRVFLACVPNVAGFRLFLRSKGPGDQTDARRAQLRPVKFRVTDCLPYGSEQPESPCLVRFLPLAVMDRRVGRNLRAISIFGLLQQVTVAS